MSKENDLKELRIIVAGGRDFTNYPLLESTLFDLLAELDDSSIVDRPEDVKFISGCCKGADVFGGQFAKMYGYQLILFPPEWDKYGKSAGYRRNCEMAKYASEAQTGILVAFWDGKSKGTKNMIDIANRYGLYVKVINY